MGHPKVMIVVMAYCGGFVIVRMKVCGTFWFVKVHLLSNSLHSLVLKLLNGTLFHKYSHGSKIFLFQANSNLIRHLQFDGEVASSKERKNTHK